MPYLELPNKKVIQVAEGVSYEDALNLAKRKFPFLYEDRGIGDRATSALGKGIGELGETASGIGAGVQSLFGGKEGVQKYIESQKEDRKKQAGEPQSITLQNLIDQYKTQGLLPALGNVPAYVTEQVLQNAPSMAAPLAAGAAATAYSAPFLGPAAPLAGLAAGMGAYGLQTFGSNIQRQAGTEGRTAETMAPGTALGTAAATAPIGFLVDRFTLGLGKIPEKAAANLIAKEIAARGVGKTLAVGAAKGLLEVPTEVLEQAAERMQAGLSLTDKEAKAEYLEAAGGALALGTVGGAGAAYQERGAARTQVAEQEETKQAAERVKRKALAAAAEEKAGQSQAFTDIPTQFGGAPVQTQTDLFQDVAAPYSPLPSIDEKANEEQIAAKEKENARRSIFEEHQKVSAGVADLTKTAAEARNRQDWEAYEAAHKQLLVFENAQEELEKKAKQEGVALPTSSASIDAKIQKLEEKIRKAATEGKSVASFLPELNALKQQKQQASYQGSLFEKTPEWEKADAAQEAAFTQKETDQQAAEKARAAGTSMFEQAYGEEENRREDQNRIVTQRAFQQERKQKQEEYNLGKTEKDVQKFTENAPIEAILVGQGRELNDTTVRHNSINAINSNLEQGLVTKDAQKLLGLNISKNAFSLQTAEEAQDQTKRRLEQSKELAAQKAELEKKLSASGESALQNEEMRALAAVTEKKSSTPEELMHAYRYGLATKNEALTNEAAAQLSEQEGAVEAARKGEVDRATANAESRVKEAKDKAQKNQIKNDLQEEVDSINAQYTKDDAAFSVLTHGAFQPHSNVLNLKNKRQADAAITAIQARIEELEQERKTKFPSKELVDGEGNLTKSGKEYVGVDASLAVLKRLLAQAQKAKPEPMQPQLAASRAVEQEKARENAVFEFGNTVDSLRKGDYEGQSREALLKQADEQIKLAQDAAIAEINYRRVERDQRALTAAEEKEVRDSIAARLAPLPKRARAPALSPMREKLREALNKEITKQEKILAGLREKKAYLPAISAVEKRIEALKDQLRRLSGAISRGMTISNERTGELAKIRNDIQSIVSSKNKEPSKYGADFGSIAEIEEQQRVQKERQESAETPDKTDFGSIAEIEEQKRVQEERRTSAETFLSSAAVKERVEKRMAPIRAEADRRIEAIEKRASRRKPLESRTGLNKKSLARAATLSQKDVEEIQGIKRNVSQRYQEIQKVERVSEQAKEKQKEDTAGVEKSRQQLLDAQKQEVQDAIDEIKKEFDHQIALASTAIHNLRRRTPAIKNTLEYAASMVERGEKDLYNAEDRKRFEQELKDIEKEKDFQERLIAELGSSEHLAFLVANDKKVQALLRELNRLEKLAAKAKTEKELVNAKKRAREALAATRKLAKERADKTRDIVDGVHGMLGKWKAAGIARTSTVEFLTYKEAVATIRNLKKQVEVTAKKLGLSKAKAFDMSAVVQKTDESAELNKQRKETIALFRFYEKQASDLAPLVQQMESIANDIKELSDRLGIAVINAYKPLSYPTKPDRKLNDKRLELIERYDSVLQQLRIKERPKTTFAPAAIDLEEKAPKKENEYSQQTLETAARNLPHAHARVTAQLEVIREQLKKPKAERKSAAAAARAAIAKIDAAINKEKASLEETKLTVQEKSSIDQEIKALREIKNAEEVKLSSNSNVLLEKRRAELNTVLLNIEAQAEKYGLDLANYAFKEQTAAAQAKAVAEGLAAEMRGGKRKPPQKLRTGSPEAKRQEEIDKLIRQELRNQRRAERAGEERYDTNEEAAAAYAVKQDAKDDYRTATEADSGIDVVKAKGVVDRVKQNLPKGIDFTYVETLAGLPADVRRAMAAAGHARIKGVVTVDGRVFIVGETHKNTNDLEETISHELIGHYGVDTILGKEGVQSLTNRLFAQGNQHVAEVATGLGVFDDVESALFSLEAAQTSEAQEEIKTAIVREMIAHAAEGTRVAPRFADKVIGFIKNVIAAVRSWYRSLGMSDMAKLNTKEIQALIKQSAKELGAGKLGIYKAPSDKAAFRKDKMPAGFEAVQEFSDAAIASKDSWLGKVKKQPWAQTALGIKIAKFDRIAAFEELADKMIKAGNGNQAMQMMYDLQGLSDVMSMASASAYDGALVRVKDPNRPGEYRYQASGGASLRSTDKLLKPLLNKGFTPESASNLFTAYMTTLRGKSVGYEKLNFSDEVQKMIKDVIPNIQANNEVLDILNKAREEYNEYNKGQIEFLESSGQISSKVAQEMRSKKDYIPYYRDVQGSLKLFIGDMNPVTLGDLKHQKHLQKLVGGEQKILNYFDSSMQNTMILTDLALTNFAKRNTITALNTMGLLQPIGGTKGPTIRGGNGPENANVIRFKDNGDDKHVVVNTEGTPYEYIPTELLIKGLEGVPFVLPGMVKMLGAPAQWLRKGITLNPLYPYYQLVKDSNAMGVTRGVSYSNIISVLKGIKSYLSNEKLIKELQSRGVIQQREMFSGSTEDSTINRRRIVGGESGFQQFLAGQEGRAIKADGAVRAMLYDAYIKQGLSERDAEYMIRKAMPYSRRGLDPSLRYLSHMIPFFNAQIVGLYSLYQSFLGQGPMSEKLQIKKKLFAAGMNMALGTLIYSALVSGEDWYENMPMETRLRNWLIKVPGVKEPVAVPIPFEFGIIFKSFFEATYMGMFKDTPEGKQVFKAFKNQLLGAFPGGTVPLDAVPIIGAVPMPLPTAVVPALEAAFNMSFYTSNPIETRQDLEKIPEERFHDTTSELAKTLGKAAGISPLQIDSLIRGYTGTTGPAVIALIDAFTAPASTTGAKPETMPSKTPLLSQIFKPVDGGAIINMAIETLQEAAQIENTYKSMLNEGREAEAEKFLTKNMSVIERGPASLAGKFRQQLGEYKKAETAIKIDTGLNAKQKRDQLDELRSEKIQLGKDYMQAFRSGA